MVNLSSWPKVEVEVNQMDMSFKALHYKLFFFKALSKRLWKLIIKTKQLSQLKLLSLLMLMINKQFLTKIGGNN